MRKLIVITFITMMMVSLTCNAQYRHFKNDYRVLDTLVINNIPSVNPTNDGDYLISMPKAHKFVVAYNNDRTKAIVLHGYPWAKRMEYIVKYEGHRLILYFKDEHIYCGYIYDEKAKACQYFEAINELEKEKLAKKFPFIKRMPTFSEEKN